jgi:hypothetical protein
MLPFGWCLEMVETPAVPFWFPLERNIFAAQQQG